MSSLKSKINNTTKNVKDFLKAINIPEGEDKDFDKECDKSFDRFFDMTIKVFYAGYFIFAIMSIYFLIKYGSF